MHMCVERIWHMVRLQIQAIETKEINKTKIQRTCKIPNNFERFLFSFASNSRCRYICCWWRGLMLEDKFIFQLAIVGTRCSCRRSSCSLNEFKTKRIISKIVPCHVHELSVIKLNLTITFYHVCCLLFFALSSKNPEHRAFHYYPARVFKYF